MKIERDVESHITSGHPIVVGTRVIVVIVTGEARRGRTKREVYLLLKKLVCFWRVQNEIVNSSGDQDLLILLRGVSNSLV